MLKSVDISDCELYLKELCNRVDMRSKPYWIHFDLAITFASVAPNFSAVSGT